MISIFLMLSYSFIVFFSKRDTYVVVILTFSIISFIDMTFFIFEPSVFFAWLA